MNNLYFFFPKVNNLPCWSEAQYQVPHLVTTTSSPLLSPRDTLTSSNFRPLLHSSASSSSSTQTPLSSSLPATTGITPGIIQLSEGQHEPEVDHWCMWNQKKSFLYTYVLKDCLNCISSMPRILKFSSSTASLRNFFEWKPNNQISKPTFSFINNSEITRRKKLKDCS